MKETTDMVCQKLPYFIQTEEEESCCGLGVSLKLWDFPFYFWGKVKRVIVFERNSTDMEMVLKLEAKELSLDVRLVRILERQSLLRNFFLSAKI